MRMLALVFLLISAAGQRWIGQLEQFIGLNSPVARFDVSKSRNGILFINLPDIRCLMAIRRKRECVINTHYYPNDDSSICVDILLDLCSVDSDRQLTSGGLVWKYSNPLPGIASNMLAKRVFPTHYKSVWPTACIHSYSAPNVFRGRFARISKQKFNWRPGPVFIENERADEINRSLNPGTPFFSHFVKGSLHHILLTKEEEGSYARYYESRYVQPEPPPLPRISTIVLGLLLLAVSLLISVYSLKCSNYLLRIGVLIHFVPLAFSLELLLYNDCPPFFVSLYSALPICRYVIP